MNNLKILEFYKSFPQGDSNVILRESIKNLSHTLTFLRWDGFPQKHLPLEFCPKNLVKLDMRESDLEKLWEGDDQVIFKLHVKFICVLLTNKVLNF
jgi:hypothetical protein